MRILGHFSESEVFIIDTKEPARVKVEITSPSVLDDEQKRTISQLNQSISQSVSHCLVSVSLLMAMMTFVVSLAFPTVSWPSCDHITPL